MSERFTDYRTLWNLSIVRVEVQETESWQEATHYSPVDLEFLRRVIENQLEDTDVHTITSEEAEAMTQNYPVLILTLDMVMEGDTSEILYEVHLGLLEEVILFRPPIRGSESEIELVWVYTWQCHKNGIESTWEIQKSLNRQVKELVVRFIEDFHQAAHDKKKNGVERAMFFPERMVSSENTDD